MNTTRLIHKNTILLIAIFVIGIVIAMLYINAAFEENTNSHTATPSITERVSYNS